MTTNLGRWPAATLTALLCTVGLGWPEGRAAAGEPGGAFRISGPHVFENLDVYLVHGPEGSDGRKLLPLSEALRRRQVVVRETGTVSQLTIENLSSEVVFVQAGEIVKGGRQDRVLGTDLILPPKSGQVPIPSHCVEQGRWRKRGDEADDRFATSQSHATNRDLKIANHKGSQAAVWANVAKVQQQLQSKLNTEVRSAESASSLQLTLENPQVRRSADAFVQALSGIVTTSPDAIGYAFALNGEINSAEVYASRALFLEMWPKLLRSSAVEAVAERTDSVAHVPPTLDSVRTFLEDAEAGTASQKPAGPGARAVVRETSSRLVVETQVVGSRGFVHRSYLRK